MPALIMRYILILLH